MKRYRQTSSDNKITSYFDYQTKIKRRLIVAIRIRKDGRMLCAKYHKEEEGDIYVNDSIHEYLDCYEEI